MLSDYGKKVTNLSTAVIALALITEYMRPRNNTAQLIEAIGKSQADLVRAAMGPQKPKLSPAERFAEKADELIDGFWRGMENLFG